MIERVFTEIKKYPLSLFVLAVIIYLSFFKPPTTPFDRVKNLDKIIHFVMYGGFCAILWFEYFLTHSKIRINRVLWGAVIIPALFSGGIEFAQSYLTDYRGGELADFIFNSLGIAFAALFSIYVTRPFMKKYNLLSKRVDEDNKLKS